LSTHLRQKEERLEEILEHLAEEVAEGTPIIVEGIKDLNTLAALGVSGQVISAKSAGKSLFDLVSEIEDTGTREVILLLDFDRRGKEWTGRLKELLERKKITPNTIFWRELLGLVGKEVKDVEGLVSYMETLKSKISGNS
jgi:5S rRNA maturation endonuclease (ribonuclease M5)